MSKNKNKPQKYQSIYSDEQKRMIKHNVEIIEDNIFYGLKWGYTDEEIDEYEKQAWEVHSLFKKHLREGGTPIYDLELDMYLAPNTKHIFTIDDE